MRQRESGPVLFTEQPGYYLCEVGCRLMYESLGAVMGIGALVAVW